MDKPKIIIASLGLALASISTVQARSPKDHRPPPQEAIDACAEKASDDTCNFTHRDRQVEGTCFAPDEDKPLACRPDHPPGPPPEGQDA